MLRSVHGNTLLLSKKGRKKLDKHQSHAKLVVIKNEQYKKKKYATVSFLLFCVSITLYFSFKSMMKKQKSNFIMTTEIYISPILIKNRIFWTALLMLF